jgi:hypothetical protein
MNSSTHYRFLNDILLDIGFFDGEKEIEIIPLNIKEKNESEVKYFFSRISMLGFNVPNHNQEFEIDLSHSFKGIPKLEIYRGQKGAAFGISRGYFCIFNPYMINADSELMIKRPTSHYYIRKEK